MEDDKINSKKRWIKRKKRKKDQVVDEQEVEHKISGKSEN